MGERRCRLRSGGDVSEDSGCARVEHIRTYVKQDHIHVRPVMNYSA